MQGGTDTAIAVGDNGTILQTTNGGESWTKKPNGTQYNSLRDVCFVRQNGTNIGFAVGESGTILKTTNGGESWSTQSSGTSEMLNSVCFTDANTGTVVGGLETILRTTNGGTTWQKSFKDPGIWLNSVYFADKDTGWVVGDNGLILKTTDGAITWTKLVSGASRSLIALQFIDNKIGWIVGAFGKILKTNNGGITSVIKNEIKYNPDNFYLSQNYPNPFNPTTNFEFRIPNCGFVSLKVYDLLGREAATVVEKELAPGEYHFPFNILHIPLSSGVYFYQLKAGNHVETKKMILLR